MTPSVGGVLRPDHDDAGGESGRVAQRVRDLLQAHVHDEDAEPPDWVDDGPDQVGDGPNRMSDSRDRGDDNSAGQIAPISLGRRIAARVPVRIDPGRRSVLALAAAVVLAAVVTGVWLSSSRPDPVPVSAAVPKLPAMSVPMSLHAPESVGGSRAVGTASSSVTPVVIVVDVAGRVHRPGVYRLPGGSRVDDALKAAGGALRGVDVSSLNLAAVLVDGQQVAVGRPGATGAPSPLGPPSAAAGGQATSSANGSPVNLNTATLDQLETLPGIGPALGQRILDYRTEHGSFTGVDKLDDVSGIGSVTFARLKPLVTV